MATWVSNILDLKKIPPENIIFWLEKPKNLGAALRKICNQLTLEVLDESFAPALTEEIDLLASLTPMAEKSFFIRQIYLIGDGIPLSYGRVVVPKFVYLKLRESFESLGTKLIGETMLYNNPKTTRSLFEYAGITPAQDLYGLAMQSLPSDLDKPEILWGRRSVFHVDGVYPLLISEFLLSHLSSMP